MMEINIQRTFSFSSFFSPCLLSFLLPCENLGELFTCYYKYIFFLICNRQKKHGLNERKFRVCVCVCVCSFHSFFFFFLTFFSLVQMMLQRAFFLHKKTKNTLTRKDTLKKKSRDCLNSL